MNTKRMKKLIAVFIVLILVGSLAGCTTFDNFKRECITGEKEDVVRIGIFEPMSGTDKEAAEKEIRGIELAHGLHPTVDGKKVELIYEDNRSDIEAAETAIQNLIRNNPSVILGSYGNANSLVAAEFIEKANIPAITMTNTNPMITSTASYYFRVCYVDTEQGAALATYAAEGLGMKKAALLVPESSEQPAIMAQKFMNRFIELTGSNSSIAANVEYREGTMDFTEQLTLIKNSGATVLFVPAETEDVKYILKQASEMELNITIMGVDEWDAEALEEALKDSSIEEVVLTGTTDIDAVEAGNKSAKAFFEAYHNMYGTDSVPDGAVALGYDAYMIAIQAIAEASSDADGARLRETMFGLTYNGVSGSIKFNAQGDPEKSVTIYSLNVKTKETAPVYMVAPDGTGSNI